VAILYHLVLKFQDGSRTVGFHFRGVEPNDHFIKGAVVKSVGTTLYSERELYNIGLAMIKEFGNYHKVFWNCQVFAKCYLRVVTGNATSFEHLTSADTTNLFLCAFILTSPIGTAKIVKQRSKETRLEEIGEATVRDVALPISEDPTDEEVFELSDRIIDRIKASLEDEQRLAYAPVKDSADKRGLLSKLWTMFRW